MRDKSIYLAGPIAGNTKGEANDWRKDMICRLAEMNIRGISPLRCEPIIGERYGLGHDDDKFGTSRAIASKNMLDVRTCDLTLCYFPIDLTYRDGPSMGTICELAWAKMADKPTILVSTHPKVVAHPVVSACSSWVLPSLDDALEVIEGIFGDYVRPIHDLYNANKPTTPGSGRIA
jgi:nucleoside 2-deoxyribosyltransferase